jgi:RNA-directed DNA polymerase
LSLSRDEARRPNKSIVPSTSADNEAAEASAESSEGRDFARRNAEQADTLRTQGWENSMSFGLHGVREATRKDSQLKFTALFRHINEDCLRDAYFNLKRHAAVGVDEVTWQEYEQDLESNIVDLHERIHQADGRERPSGIAWLENKIVQQATVWVLQVIYEQDFVGFSYGFRPGRSQHDALDALSVEMTSKRVNWILDADVEGCLISSVSHTSVPRLECQAGSRFTDISSQSGCERLWRRSRSILRSADIIR